MDVKDVSEVDSFIDVLRNAQNTAERASRREGEVVRDHPPSEKLVTAFLVKLHAKTIMGSLRPDRVDISTSLVPAPYAPCVQPSGELEPIMISDMKLETHHRGTKVLLRVRTPPQRITAVMAIVQDEQGTAILLQLYNQPEESVVPAREIIRPNGVCILKEPFFKCATSDGSYSLRVDHPGDIVWLTDTDERVPSKWRQTMLAVEDSSTSIRMRGNDAVQNQDWAAAQRLYSSAIQTAVTSQEQQLAHLNRSLANLKLGNLEEALLDANRGSDAEFPSEKRLFREARALYELGNFSTCLEKLQVLASSYPGNPAVKPEMDRAGARLREQETGDYRFLQMYGQARKTPPFVDCATFSAAVEARPSPGRGRGLFTTRPVSAGQLLLCEKAFAYSFADDDRPAAAQRMLMNLSTKKMTMGGQAHLLTQVVQKLYHNPQMLALFRDLHHGDYTAVPDLESDGHPVVDSFLVERTISLNSFGAPRTSRRSYMRTSSPDDMLAGGTGTSSYATSGIWLLASRINHSCVGNCHRSFIGDMQIVRATRDLPAGTELFFCYRVPEPLESYEETQKRLASWGFTCDCGLCEDKKSTPPQPLRKRKSLRGQPKTSLNNPNLKASQTNRISKIQQQLKQLEETYPKTDASAVRPELWDAYFALGAVYLSAKRSADAVEAIVKGLEALGYGITACPPAGDVRAPGLEVRRWGIVNESTPWAFLHMYKAYRTLAPGLRPTAKRYVETAYMMVVGEGETASECFPDLA